MLALLFDANKQWLGKTKNRLTKNGFLYDINLMPVLHIIWAYSVTALYSYVSEKELLPDFVITVIITLKALSSSQSIS